MLATLPRPTRDTAELLTADAPVSVPPAGGVPPPPPPPQPLNTTSDATATAVPIAKPMRCFSIVHLRS